MRERRKANPAFCTSPAEPQPTESDVHRNNYINAAAAYQNSLDQFKIKLGLPLGEKLLLDDDALAEVDKTGLVPVALVPEGAYRLAVQKQLPLLNAIDRFEDSKRKIRLAADRLKADLNLLADASLDSEPPTDYTQFDAGKVRAGVGLELNLPLDRLRERNDYRATLVSFESELRSLTLAFDTLKENIDRGLRPWSSACRITTSRRTPSNSPTAVWPATACSWRRVGPKPGT